MIKFILTSVDFGSPHPYGVLVRPTIVPNRAEDGRRSLEEGCMTMDTIIDRSLDLVKVDFAPTHRQPALARLLVATVVSLVGSLAADAVLVVIGEAVFPSTKGYTHFQFSDYSKLTVIGVVVACVAWPIVTRITSSPRWLFFRLAIVVTLVLLLPDLYILHQGQPAKAVVVLMVMHLAIALVTYNALVHLAPIRSQGVQSPTGPG
jgi:hypothetical protein